MFKEEPQIYLNIKFNDTEEALPVNPEKLQITRGANNADIDIIGLGPATRKGHPGLISMKISSFFPHLNSPFNYFGKSPEHYIKFLNKIWEADNDNNRVATLTTIGLTPRIDTLPFVIESFDYEHRGGDFDIYYNLSIKEYVPYGAKVKTISSEGTKTSRIASGEVSKSKTYTVMGGDTLSGITKRCTGGTGDWRVLYELNKEVIGGNPNLIRPGQVLTLPEDWNAPVKSTGSSTAKKKTTKKTVPSQKTVVSREEIKMGASLYEKITYSDGSQEIVIKQAGTPLQDMWASYEKEHKQNISRATIADVNTPGTVAKAFLGKENTDTRDMVQIYYNRALSVYNDNTKSDEEKVKALKEIKATETNYVTRNPLSKSNPLAEMVAFGSKGSGLS